MASQEKKIFDKYLKFLTYKVTQVVVQSKQGRLVKTRSMPYGNEWFNLTIEDDKQVMNTLRRSLEGRLPQQDCPVCIEIAMETLEGERLVLEQWAVDVDYSQRDVGVSVTHLLYPRLSVLLRSVMAVSRTTPAYRLSRQQEDGIKFESSQTSVTDSSVMTAQPTDSMISESVTGRPLSCPFAPSESTSQQQTGKYEESPQLFSAILPRPSVSDPLASLSPQTSRQDSSSSTEKAVYSREQSDSGSTLRKETDGYIMVDFEKITPTFANSDGEDVTNFLQPSSDIPDLDMFNEDTSMDLTAAMVVQNE